MHWVLQKLSRRLEQLVIVVALLFVSCASIAEQSDALKASKQFASQRHACGLDHGYQCRSAEESNFLGLEADNAMVPAVYLSAWQQALTDFNEIEDLSEQEKQLQHYKIGFSENEAQYVVHFQALLLPAMEQGKPQGLLRGTVGRTTRYWINKSTMTIDKRLFYR